MRSLDPLVVVTAGPEPAYCPRCELRHTRRPDWLCPRCGSPVDTEVPPPRTTPPPPLAPPFPLGTRIAGALLLATSGALAIARAQKLTTFAAVVRHGQLLVAVAVLAGLGVGLLLKRPVARWAAVALAVVAAVILSEGLVRDLSPGLVRDPLPAPVRQALRNLIPDHRPWKIVPLLGLDAGCLLLTVGRPRAWRVIAGVLVAAPLLVLEVISALGR
jgi:hypothetical protein